MRHFKAFIEYDGTDFAGFQWQHGTRTVQGEFESVILLRTGQSVRITGAGRTDAGVHALGQVISFSAETRIPIESMAYAFNSALPADLSVRTMEEVGPEFSARFSASSRIYLYLILNRRTPSAIWNRYSALVCKPLDVSRMQNAAGRLLGERDFAAFTNELNPEKETMRDLMRCDITRRGEFLLARVEANAFLRGMVRTMIGTLIDVGVGKRDPEEIAAVLASRDRRQAGPSAPAQGLCLLRVRYGVRKNYTRRVELSEENP